MKRRIAFLPIWMDVGFPATSKAFIRFVFEVEGKRKKKKKNKRKRRRREKKECEEEERELGKNEK